MLAVGSLALLIYVRRKSRRNSGRFSAWLLGIGAIVLPCGVIAFSKSMLFGKGLVIPEMYRVYVMDLVLGQLKIFFVIEILLLLFVFLQQAEWGLCFAAPLVPSVVEGLSKFPTTPC